MLNFVQKGECITVPDAGGTVVSGQAVQFGQLFGVATHDAGSGEELVIQTTGVVDIPKTGSQAWTFGALVYWTGTEATTTSSGNLPIGCAVLATGAGAGETTGRVRLNGTAVADA